MNSFTVSTRSREEMVDITRLVQESVTSSGLVSGAVVVFVPHTTCGITINENTDPDVIRDILFQLKSLVPYEKGYRHFEGNSDSHIKTTLTGSSVTVIIEKGRLQLGTWQGIFLCDYDGPRTRSVWVKMIKD